MLQSLEMVDQNCCAAFDSVIHWASNIRLMTTFGVYLGDVVEHLILVPKNRSSTSWTQRDCAFEPVVRPMILQSALVIANVMDSHSIRLMIQWNLFEWLALTMQKPMATKTKQNVTMLIRSLPSANDHKIMINLFEFMILIL